MKTKVATLQLLQDETGAFSVESDDGVDGDPVSGDVLDHLIAALGEQRETALPQVPVDAPAGISIPIAPASVGAGAARVFPHGNVICLRHPRFGWLGFQLSPQELQSLQQDLAALPAEASPRH